MDSMLSQVIKPRFGIVYRIINIINGKIYIGITIRPLRERFWEHKKAAHDLYISRAIKKYGKQNFVIEEIDSADSEEELIYLEKYWIRFYRSCDALYGYNLTNGGESSIISKKTKFKLAKFFVKCLETNEIYINTKSAADHKNISEAAIYLCFIGRNKTAGGFSWTKIPKDGISIDQTIDYHNPDKIIIKKNIRSIKCNETGEIYKSLSEAAKTIGISAAYLIKVIKENKCWNGYTYSYASGQHQSFSGIADYDRSSFSKKILCRESGQIWPSIRAAAGSLGISHTRLSRIINVRNGNYNGLTYIYLDDTLGDDQK